MPPCSLATLMRIQTDRNQLRDGRQQDYRTLDQTLDQVQNRGHVPAHENRTLPGQEGSNQTTDDAEQKGE